MAQIHPALGASARMTWKVVSFPLIAGLLLLKPVVDALCVFVLVFGLVAAVAFDLSAVGPRFPFLQIAGMALGFGLFAALYRCLILTELASSSWPTTPGSSRRTGRAIPTSAIKRCSRSCQRVYCFTKTGIVAALRRRSTSTSPAISPKMKFSLRADVLRELLQHCTNIKTVRLCLQLGREASLPWAAKLDPATLPTGSDRPWVSQSADGLLVLKP